jgi:LysR family glycine cleavage system transcriptional activator
MPASPSLSLRALQAFTAVARLGSVVRAAEELTVTPSAVSHLLRQLEQRLGVPLLLRKGRGHEMTADGAALAAAVGPALLNISDALDTFRRRGSELRISLLSSFAVHWLIPRLARFQARHPDIELLLSTSTRMVDLGGNAFDCAIRLGRGGWSGLMAEPLYREELVVACSPRWLESHRAAAPRDLLRATLLHSRARRRDWNRWFEAAGVNGARTDSGPVFETRALAIQAAIAQMGVLIIDPRFIESELAAGQLSLPFALRVPLENSYWLVWRAGRESSRPVAAFRRWLAGAAAIT